MLRRTLNLGILAHVDAGKTTLTERLLYAAGVIRDVGSVDKGTTQTDSLALEQQRGITIKSAVVSFPIDDVTVNLIDTPGHPDFIAEVERVLSVLDGCVVVISAVEGVQPQTRILMRALQRLHVPTLLFVNKIDRAGADPERVLDEIEQRLTPDVVPMGSADGLGTRTAAFAPFGPADGDLAGRARAGTLHPVFFGSALTGAGVAEVMAGIAQLLPAREGRDDGPLSARVFKIERDPDGHRIAYTRVFSGSVSVRDRFDAGKVTAVRVFADGDAVQRDVVQAGEIAKLWGLAEIQIGDWLGEPRRDVEHHFAPPTFESVVEPADPADGRRLRAALGQLAEQDPLIDVRQDDTRAEISVSLYGEVQREVIEATLADEYGLEVAFHDTTTICVERPTGSGEAVEILNTPTNPFHADLGLRVEPAAPGSGVEAGRRRRPRPARRTALHLQDLRCLRGASGRVRAARARRRPVRVAGHRLRGDRDEDRLQPCRRPALTARPDADHTRREAAGAARPHAGARAGGHGGLRARLPDRRRGADSRRRPDARRPGQPRRRSRRRPRLAASSRCWRRPCRRRASRSSAAGSRG